MNQSRFGPYSAALTASTAALGAGTHRVEASMVFADVSGYTALTERLATLGRVGSEMVTDTVNTCFTRLIDVARHHGGDVLRFGGDALFLAFTGPGRLDRALQAASEMQRGIATLPTIAVPGRRVRLRQSIGVHDGELLLHVWRGSWTEVVPYGQDVTETLRCEAAAHAGEIAISEAVARTVPAQRLRRRDDGQALYRRTTRTEPAPAAAAVRAVGGASADLIGPQVRAAVTAGVVPEHRAGAIGFVALKGLDRAAAGDQLDALLTASDRVAHDLGVAVLGTDVAPDGIKLIVAAGVPTAQGDDAERLAVALDAIVRSVGTVGADARAGADQGVVFCGDVGHPERRTFTVMGDTVNLAARLAARAERGTVLASAVLVDALSHQMDVRFVPPFTVKGKRAVQRAAVVTPAADGGPDQGSGDSASAPALPLRGRTAELRTLRSLLESFGAVEIVGATGLGASRLLSAALDTGTGIERRHTVAHITAGVGDRSSPLMPMRRMIEMLGGRRAWADVQHEAFGRRDPHHPSPTVDTGLAAVSAVARGVERYWPDAGVVVVESTHHLDEASRRVLDVLAVGLHDGPRGRLLVLTGRSRCLTSASAVVDLGPLTTGAVRQIAVDAATAPLSDATLESIVGIAAGSPLLAVQLARLGRDAQLPPSAEALVASRLDRLAHDVRRVVRELAVLGPVTDLGSVVSITGRDPGEIVAAVRRATEVVRLQGTRIEFVEESTRLVAAGGMALARRRELHARAAVHLEHGGGPAPGPVADHWFAAGDHVGVLRWGPQAADVAIGAGASDEACEHLRRALLAAEALGRPDDERFELADRTATTAQRAGRRDLESWALSIAVSCAGSTSRTARTLVRRAAAERSQQRVRAATAHLTRAMRLADPTDVALQSEIAVERAWIAVWTDHWSRAHALAETAVRLAEGSADPRLRFATWSLLEQIRSAKALPGANEAAFQAVRASRATGDERLIGGAEMNMALIADNMGHWQEAVSCYTRSMAAFERCGDVVNAAKTRFALATVLVELGRLDDATEMSADATRVTAAAGDATSSAASACVTLRSRIRTGGLESARDPISRASDAVAFLVASGEDEMAAFSEIALIEILLLCGRADDARTRATALLPRADRYGDEHLLPSTVRRLLGVAEWLLGARPTARIWLVAARALAERHTIVPELAAIAALEAHWAGLEGTPEAQPLIERSAHLDADLGVVSRPWFIPRPGPVVIDRVSIGRRARCARGRPGVLPRPDRPGRSSRSHG